MGQSNVYFRAGGRDWAERQLREAGHDVDGVVVALVNSIFDHVDYLHDNDAEQTEVAATLAAKLLMGSALTEADWTAQKLSEGYRWLPVVPRSIQMGDVVRVRQDAYSDPDMARHNGEQGRVSGIRNGYHVVYDSMVGQGSTTMGFRHQAEKLERRVKIAPEQ